MRVVQNINCGWKFSMDAQSVPQSTPKDWETINLPHTWNGLDGQDGGNDYRQGTGYYAKVLYGKDLPGGKVHYLEIKGANSVSDVFFNGQHLGHHEGGYSLWRVHLPEEVKEENLLIITADNRTNTGVYPMRADFTFYGGVYRDVNLISVAPSHFALVPLGTPGIHVTPVIEGKDAKVKIHTQVQNQQKGQSVLYRIYDQVGNTVVSGKDENLVIQNVHLWNGTKDPYLYTAEAVLLDTNGDRLDCVTARFGCRTFDMDPQKGFFLNGESYPLRGVCRHQDREGIGNALLPEHHLEDMDIICEMGANTLRLAHYQQDPYFYDLCDERGMIVWAEIPYISKHVPSGNENTFRQMQELIIQNYNHPSIVVWGLSNETTMGVEPADVDDMTENHRALNELVHKMDPTRKTVIAAVSTCEFEHPYLQHADVISYNLYNGWYRGEMYQNGEFLDSFHQKYPNIPIGLSEYGCEALNWHFHKPRRGDYTEEYQAYFHEEMIKQIFDRPYLWATHVWNMFDFGSDRRAEGGVNGRNNKGLVTLDRKYKKDAFYAYKAWLSEEPFVHICGKRFVKRHESVTRVNVYSNQQSVELFVNGVSIGKQEAQDHFFRFDVPNQGESILTAVAGDCRDESRIEKVDTICMDYVFREAGAVLNWFDLDEVDGCFSLNDYVKYILASEQGRKTLMDFFKKVMMGAQAAAIPAEVIEPRLIGMLKTMEDLSGVQMFNAIAASGRANMTQEVLIELNRQLNKIAK